MNKKFLFVALFLVLCGITYGVLHKKPQTIIHAQEGIFSKGRLTLIEVSPKVSFKFNGKHGADNLETLVKLWEGSRSGLLVFEVTGREEFSSIHLDLSMPTYDTKRDLLSFDVQASVPLPTGSFLEPTLQLY